MAKSIFSIISLVVLAGGIVMQFFIILSGAVKGSPLNKVYFLQASTDGISGKNVPNPARWTYFALCGVQGGNNANCGKVTAALPFDPHTNFGTNLGLPDLLVNHPDRYYYLSRVAWAFFIIALFFAVVALLMGLIAPCSRLAAKFTGLITIVALLSQAVAASLMTAWTVRGRAAFKSNGQDANLGKYAYGFTWGAFAAFLIATVLFCIGGSKDKSESYSSKSSYFGRKRSTRSRGSFRDSESGRRVKDEYD